LSKLVLSFLLFILWLLPIPALFASEHDTAAPDASINALKTAPVAETVAGPEVAPVSKTSPEMPAESSDPVADANVTETVPETTVVTEEPSVSAAEVAAPAAAVAVPPVVGPATESVLENAPVAGTDEAVAAPIVDEEAPVPTASGDAGVNELSGQEGRTMPAAAVLVKENAPSTPEAGIENTGMAEPAPPETVVAKFLNASKLELFAGVSMMNFDYTEFDTNGAWLDDENGWLPGLLLGGTLYWPGNWYASLELNYYFGDVIYEGQTQSDDPALSGLYINSRSDTDIFDTTAIVGYQFSAARVYAGLGYYFWRRNIRPTLTNGGLRVAGMLEFYSWSYALLGFNTPLFVKEDSRINLDIRVTRMLQAQMEVDFLGYGGYDNSNLNLGEDWGLRLALPWTFRLSATNDATITIEPYYYRWDLNRSNVAELTVNGVGTGSGVVEPQSETRNLGISVYFRRSM